MSRVDGSLGSLVQGVSQQPSRARLAGQSEEEINVVNDEVFGLSRRAGSDLKAQFPVIPADSAGKTDIQYGYLNMDGSVLPYALRLSTVEPSMKIARQGTIHDVQMTADVQEYMKVDVTEATRAETVLFKEIDNKSHVVNTQVKVAMSDDLPVNITETAAAAWIRGTKFSTAYTLSLQVGSTIHHVAYVTADGAVKADQLSMKAASVIGKLYNIAVTSSSGSDGTSASQAATFNGPNSFTGIAKRYYATPGAKEFMQEHFNFSMRGSVMVINPKSAAAKDGFEIIGTDASGAELFVAIRNTAKQATTLPTRATVGQVVRITGDASSKDDYFVRYRHDGYAFGAIPDTEGYWEECTAPKQKYKLDAKTMPHKLVWDGTNFTISTRTWAERSAGNDESNPVPKMVGKTINDMGDFQGRAVYLHGPYVQMSASDEYTTLWRTTTTALLDSDPINVRSTAIDGKNELAYAVPFNRDLVLFATNNTQLMMSGRSTITPNNAAIVPTGEYDTDLMTRPKPVGENILFTSFSGKFTHMHELYLRGSQAVHARRTITDHIPQYIKGRTTILAASDGNNTALLIADDKRTAYVYEYLVTEEQRLQSAWSQWRFGADIVACVIDQGVMYALLKTANGGVAAIEMILYRQDHAGLSFPIHLDGKQQITLADSDTFDMVYGGNSTDGITAVRLSGNVPGSGILIESKTPKVSTTPNLVTVKLKKKVTGDIIVGEAFNTRFVPTMPVIRDRDGVAVTTAKLTVNNFYVTCDTTGPFTMIRECTYEKPADYWRMNYSGRTLGDPDFRLGTVPIDSATIEFPFSDSSTTSKLAIECSTHYPMTLPEIEWDGNVKNRSQRITQGG